MMRGQGTKAPQLPIELGRRNLHVLIFKSKLKSWGKEKIVSSASFSTPMIFHIIELGLAHFSVKDQTLRIGECFRLCKPRSKIENVRY